MQNKSIPENALKNPTDHIIDTTGAKIRVFLNEIAEGVANYRSLHSLTQQVEHQGLFLAICTA